MSDDYDQEQQRYRYEPDRVGDLQAGDVIDIEIKGARVVRVKDGNVLVYATDAGGRPLQHVIHIGSGWPGHTVRRVAPAEWPPRAGDMWRIWAERTAPIDREAWERDPDRYQGGSTRVMSPILLVATASPDGGVYLSAVGTFWTGQALRPYQVMEKSRRIPELVTRLPESLADEVYPDGKPGESGEELPF